MSSVFKVLEIISGSPKSWEEAARNAVKEASKSVDNISSVWIKDQSCRVENGEVVEFRCNVKVTFKVGK